ncbi:putative poly-beta-1,6-N-acetyl-D-glucosamine export protein [compost metagenome]
MILYAKKEQDMKQRLYKFDDIRAFAALSVIAIHATAPYVTEEIIGFVWNQLMRYAVPLFIILSGFLLYYADRKKGTVHYGQFMRKRLTKIFIPYVIWTIVYTLFKMREEIADRGAEALPDVGGALLSFLFDGSAFVHLYFLIIMFQLYLLYPVLRLWMKHRANQALFVSFFCTFLTQTWVYIHDITKWGVQIPQVTRFLPVWLFFFVLGMYTARHKEGWEAWLRRNGLLVAVCWLVSIVLLLVDSRITETYGASIKPTVVLYTVTSYFLFYYICMGRRRWQKQGEGFVQWLSTQSFLVFLLHPLILTVLRILPREYGDDAIWDGLTGMLGLFAATTGVTLLLTYIISFTPLAAILGGVRAGRK